MTNVLLFSEYNRIYLIKIWRIVPVQRTQNRCDLATSAISRL